MDEARLELVIDDTRRLWRRTEFSFAHGRDCLMSLADYAFALTGVDPGAEWRGKYCDEAGAQALVEAGGGAIALMHDGLTGAGWKMVDQMGNVARGDIAAVEIGGRVFGGVALGRRVMLRMKARDGAFEGLLRPVAAWRCA